LLTSDSGANQEDKHTTGAIRSQSIVESSECEHLRSEEKRASTNTVDQQSA
jgi:hypothetical protein